MPAVKGAESLSSGLREGGWVRVAWAGWLSLVRPDLPSSSWGLDPQQTSTGPQETGEWYRTFLFSTDRDGEGETFTLRGDLLNRPNFCFSLPLDTEDVAPSVLNMTLPLETPPSWLQHLPHSSSLLPAESSLNWPPSPLAAPHGCFQITVLSAAQRLPVASWEIPKHVTLLSSTRSQMRVFGACLYRFGCPQLCVLLQSRKSSKLHFPTEVCNQAGF